MKVRNAGIKPVRLVAGASVLFIPKGAERVIPKAFEKAAIAAESETFLVSAGDTAEFAPEVVDAGAEATVKLSAEVAEPREARILGAVRTVFENATQYKLTANGIPRVRDVRVLVGDESVTPAEVAQAVETYRQLMANGDR